MGATTPRTPEEITPAFLTTAARRLLADDTARVTSLSMGESEPFQYPKFGKKSFDIIEFAYTGRNGDGNSRMILRRRAPRDAVSTLIADTQHRELLAFKTGLLDELPPAFHHPYLDVIHDPEHGQFWAFLEDVSIDMAASRHRRCPPRRHAADDPLAHGCLSRTFLGASRLT